MGSFSTTTSTVLGAAFVTAALALPSLQFANAEAPPERGVVSFKYLHYQESQDIVSQTGSNTNIINTVSGASSVAASGSSGSSGSQDRIGVNAYSVGALVPVAGKWSLGTTYTSDSVSGASPTYHSSGFSPGVSVLPCLINMELCNARRGLAEIMVANVRFPF